MSLLLGQLEIYAHDFIVSAPRVFAVCTECVSSSVTEYGGSGHWCADAIHFGINGNYRIEQVSMLTQ